MKIMITGDSHTGALKLGADSLIHEGKFPQDVQIDLQQLGGGGTLTAPFFIDRGGFAEMTDDKHQRRIKRLPLPDGQGGYDYYGICGPLHPTRLWRNKSYWPGYTPLTPHGDKAPVSANLLKHVILQEQRYTMQLIELLLRVGVKVFVVEAPKPFRDHPILKLVSSEVILYVDKFYRDTMRAWLAAKAVPVIAVPDHCHDSSGFMDAIYRHEKADDYYHANHCFGAIMVQEIIAFAGSAQ